LSPGTGNGDKTEAERELVEVESDTVRVRGLQPKMDVPEQFITQEQMRTNLAAEVAQDYSHEEARRDATTLWLLRLMDDPTTDLYQLQIDLLGEQVLGYYDHKKDELFVRSDQATLSPLTRVTLAHEFTHSLQDQYYDLGKIRPDKIESDRGNAVLALVEGDAVASQLAYAQNFLSSGDLKIMIDEANSISQKVLERSPRYIRDSLTFPYDQGPLFVSELAAKQPGSFKGVNDALADPPKSTEQILHPEKYLNKPRDEPVSVSLMPLTDTLGAGWTFQDTDTLGEFDIKEMLQINNVDNEAAWAGWGGAGYALYTNGEKSLVLMQSKWDTKDDAAEFTSALEESLARYKKTATSGGAIWTDSSDTRTFGVKRTGNDGVTLVAGTDMVAVQHVLDAAK
jgi:hypothetical protein